MDGNFLFYDIFIVSLMNQLLLNSCDTSNYTYNFWRRLVINKLESICLLGKKMWAFYSQSIIESLPAPCDRACKRSSLHVPHYIEAL